MSATPKLLRRAIFGTTFLALLALAPNAGGVLTDATPPSITPVYSPSLPATGWYRGNVTLNWLVVDPESVIQNMTGCAAQTFSADTPGTKVTCSATSDGGDSSSSVWIRVDKTPPSVVAAPDRAADVSDWYNRALTIGFSGADLTSGLVACSPAIHYAGPDNPTATVSGSCADKAGNSTPVSLTFKYDATAPTLFALTRKLGNRRVQLSWRKSSDTQVVEVLRAPGRQGAGESVIYRGAATGYLDTGLVVGRKYEYRVAGIDQATNRSEQKLEIVATGALLSPAPGARVTTPPRLVWSAVKGASHYNVQIFRGNKVLSAWPVRPGFRLRRTWSYAGRRHRLRPGVYRWYVWPGFGKISTPRARYGRMLGSSTFVVPG
jgi:hypothetical protein